MERSCPATEEAIRRIMCFMRQGGKCELYPCLIVHLLNLYRHVFEKFLVAGGTLLRQVISWLSLKDYRVQRVDLSGFVLLHSISPYG